ncbi:hypothetical protein PR202_gb13269 [Eleusine coracana subsp. coracana]|uniref:Uncharacterized protein n=1 Tax=Eleusine coracana subsp. coracana TaxID=191504 RepID=A0AAV5ERM5_ELECO|nr:hypothetical protein QOZ80_9BG0712670 [Eleusine coracana subsp. coracana]GJN25442.1 hypothetical protein PR202_gb13269 [Eleusine coracana subsp. coracana]
MKITVQSSKVLKPAYDGSVPSVATNLATPLTMFDKVTYAENVNGVCFFHPPVPSKSSLETGFVKALAAYREWAGRLGVDANGDPCILLNDAGATLVEATADVALSSISPLEQTPDLQSLCQSGGGDNGEEVMVVQITRFACGSFAVANTLHHLVGDGHGMCRFLMAWGNATRGATVDRIPVYDRASIFKPRNPPRVDFEHRGVEFTKPRPEQKARIINRVNCSDTVVVHRVHFTPEMLSELKSQGSAGAARPYSTLQCVAAHLWRCITMARRLDGNMITKLKIPVSGRERMHHPPVPEEYTGNVVLWAQPTTTVRELVASPLRHIVEIVSQEVARINENYFRSFIDFASSGVVEEEGLVPTAALAKAATDRSAAIFVSNMKGVPLYELDFGTGQPLFLFTRSYPPVDGFVFIMPNLSSDGGMDVQVGLFARAMDIFKDYCYSLTTANAKL